MEKPAIIVDQYISLIKPELIFSSELFNVIEKERTYLQNWLSWISTTHTEEDVIRIIRESQALNEGGQQFNLLIKFKEQIVGSIGLIRLNMRHKKGEIGYWISEAMQGKGIITKSCKKLIEYGFLHQLLNRIEIRVLYNNTKSKAIPLRLGFRQEGRLEQAIWLNDSYHDLEVFGLLRQDWCQRHSLCKEEKIATYTNLMIHEK